MQGWTLKNGLRVFYKPSNGATVGVHLLVGVGSNNENKDERGITHFIEHMVFEGTEKWPTAKEITNEIEKLGGDINAYTSNERTCFHIKILKRHVDIALKV